MRLRACDPFSPHGRRPTVDQALNQALDPGLDPAGRQQLDAEPLRWFYEDSPAPDDGLGQLKRTELVKIAEARGIKTYGTRDKLLARIRAHAAKG